MEGRNPLWFIDGGGEERSHAWSPAARAAVVSPRLPPASRCCRVLGGLRWGELELPGPPLSGEMAKDKRETQRTWRGKEESEPTAAALPRPKDAREREDNAQPTPAQLPPGSRERGLFSQGWAPRVSASPPAPR